MVSSLLPTNTIRLNKVIVCATMSNHVQFTPLNNAFNFAGFISTMGQPFCSKCAHFLSKIFGLLHIIYALGLTIRRIKKRSVL